MERNYIKLIFLICAIVITSCYNQKKTVTHTDREVYILSGGFNAGYGYNIIKINNSIVSIDTSFYPSDFDTSYIAPLKLKTNRTFNPDIQKKIKSKHIYASLMTLKLDTLKTFEIKSTERLTLDSIENKNENYTMQEIKVTEGGQTTSLTFFIPVKEKENKSEYDQFLFDLGHLFPFGSKNFYCRQFYK